MQVLWILSAVFISARVAFPQADDEFEIVGRVAHGEHYDHEKYPYVVAILMSTYNIFRFWDAVESICSGTLIAPLVVLTAAHCTDGKRAANFFIHPGSMQNRYVGVQKIHQHPAYNKSALVSDISLLKLKIPFPNIKRYSAIGGLPSDFANGTEKQCKSIGFGETMKSSYSEDGLIANVTIKHGEEACKLPESTDLDEPDVILMNSLGREFLCSLSGRPTVCPGDSGGPLICNGSQYGVVSHLIMYNESDNICGKSGGQSRFVFLHNYKDWISSSMDAISDGNSELLHHQLFITVMFTLIVLCAQR